MSDLINNYKKNVKKEETSKREKIITYLKFKIWLLKNKWKILTFFFSFIIIFFPEFSANIIANWINKFIGTLFNSISF
jgi:hypothetical protein